MPPLERLFEKLQTHDRRESPILELWTPSEKRLEVTIAREERWAVESIRHLRGLIPASEGVSK